MTNNERLSYLKNIRLKELEEKNKNNIEQGKKADSDFYTIIHEQNNVQDEIYILEQKISKGLGEEEYDDWDNPSKIAQIRNTYPYEYIGDDNFIKVNYEKEFSIEDQIALIIHSQVQPLEKKFADLQKIRHENQDNKYCKSIDAWISYNKKKINHINSICDGKELFVVQSNYSNTGKSYALVFDSLEKCLKCIEHHRVRTINIIKINSDGTGPQRSIYLTPKGQISDIKYSFGPGSYADILPEERIENIIVKLEHPFKPYTVISCPFGPCGKYIVADINNERVREKVEEWKKLCSDRNGWLGVEIPVYQFPNGWVNDDSVFEPLCLFNLPITIDELCEVPYLYEWEQEFLNCVKAKNLFEDKDK